MASTEYSLERVFASLPRTVRGLPLVISGDPKNTKFLYCNGNNVYIRDIADPTITEIYSEHAQLTTVAKYAPSGFYIASGDQSGKLRIWDTTQATHILKAEYAFIAGPIRDIAWNDDSKRLAIVGEGRDRFGHVFLFDTGTSNGNLSGQSRAMTSIDFKPSRPYRLVSGSEDNTVALFEGPPFKFKTLFHNHQRFVNSVRYNPAGTIFASGGADGKIFLSDGAEGELQGELVDPAVKGGAGHAGGVFALAWNADGSKLVTASGDKTLKIWNVSDRTLIKTITFGSAIEDQQLAVTWQKDVIVSVALSGYIYFINAETGEISNTIRGHNKPITALALSQDKKYAFTADFEGHITRWLIADGTSERLTPAVHKSQVCGMAVTPKGGLVSIGWDDTIAFTSGVFDKTDNLSPNSQRLASQPRAVSVTADGENVAVACQRGVVVFKGEREAVTLNTSYEGQSIAFSGKWLAVGGSDNKVHIYSVDGTTLTEKESLGHAGGITSLNFSPDGKFLVATDINRKVIPYKAEESFAVASEKDWTYHTARVNCGAWSPNGRFVATGGLDTNVMIWDINRSGESPIEIRGAHSASPINGVVWLDDKRILTVGQDSNLKIWSLNLP